jgi:hypothetical protein
MAKRKPAYAALFVIGLAFIPLGIAENTVFLGVGVVFFIVGAAGMAKERKASERDSDG